MNSQKIKSVKNFIIKKSPAKVFQVSIVKYKTALFWNIALALVLALHCYCERNVKYRLLPKHLLQRKRRLKKSHSNDKLLEKITSSSYHLEQNTFIEASCIYNIHTGGKILCSCCFWRFVSRLDSDRLKNLKYTLICKGILLLL